MCFKSLLPVNGGRFCCLFVMLLSLGLQLAAAQSGAGQAKANASKETKTTAVEELTGLGFGDLVSRRSGDLDMMEKERTIRVLTVYGLWSYYLDGAEQKGFVFDMFKEFETFINQRLKKGELKLNVVFVPVARDQLLTSLNEGRGDIAAAALVISPERKKLVDFSNPVSREVSEVLVTGPSAPVVKSIDDLAGQDILVRASSIYLSSLEKINDELKKRGKKPIKLVPADERLDEEDLLEMVNSGLLKWAAVSDFAASQWEKGFDHLTVREDIVFRKGGRIAYAVRKDSPLLLAALNDFLKTHRQGTLQGNMLINRDLLEIHGAKGALNESEYKRLEELFDIFKQFGEQYELDHLMLAAQGYQESRLNQNARSDRGAVGVMQLLPSTAKGKNVNIPDISTAENNIHAGVKYMDFIRTRYFSDPDIEPLNQTLFAFAAYNAGPARVRELREKTAKIGYNPNVWFDNVEYLAAKEIGHETVQYVSNILKYYIAYSLAMQQEADYVNVREKSGIK